MPLIFESLKTEVKYHLLAGNEYTVGRKDSDILLLNDPSISRNHAKLVVSEKERSSICKLVDFKSKYGTSCGNVKVSQDGCEAHSGDTITFGLCGNNFLLHDDTLLVTTSCLDKNQKKQLDVISRLGGRVISHWDSECKYLIMTGVKVTTKAISAMITQKPIVKLQFFVDWWNCAQEKKPLPSPSDYLPPIEDPHINSSQVSFHPLETRKDIFVGKTFVFMDQKQYQKLNELLKLGGGEVVFYQTKDLESLIQPGVCVMDVFYDGSSIQENSQVLDQVTAARSYLQEHNKRMIPESDIGYAVVYASTSEYCNPEFSFGSSILTNRLYVSQACTQKDVNVHNTLPECTVKNGMTLTTNIEDTADKSKSKTQDMQVMSKVHEDDKTLATVSETFSSSLSVSQKKNRLKRDRNESSHSNPEVIPSKNMRFDDTDISEVCESPEHEVSFNDRYITVKKEPVTPQSSQEIVEETLPSSCHSRLYKEDNFCNTTKQTRSTSNKRGFVDVCNDGIIPSTKRIREDNADVQVMPIRDNGSEHAHLPSVEILLPTTGYLTTQLQTHSHIKKEQSDAKDPSKYMRVVSAKLLVRKPGESIKSPVTTTGNVKNVKKFKKVQPFRSSALPRIIGRRDMVLKCDGKVVEPVQKSGKESSREVNGHHKNSSDNESGKDSDKEDRPRGSLFSWDRTPRNGRI